MSLDKKRIYRYLTLIATFGKFSMQTDQLPNNSKPSHLYVLDLKYLFYRPDDVYDAVNGVYKYIYIYMRQPELSSTL